jgi:hypothetical protein
MSGQVWDLWWTKWHWAGFLPKYFGFLCHFSSLTAPWRYYVLPQQAVPLLTFTPSVALIPGLDFGRARKRYGTETKSVVSYDKGIQTESEHG